MKYTQEHLKRVYDGEEELPHTVLSVHIYKSGAKAGKYYVRHHPGHIPKRKERVPKEKHEEKQRYKKGSEEAKERGKKSAATRKARMEA